MSDNHLSRISAKFAYDTPLTPLIDIALNGSIWDLLDAANRVSRTDRWGVVAWIDSSISFALTSAMALIRLAYDLALTIFYSLTWPFSASSRNSCKSHLIRAAIDLTAILGSLASIFYPPMIKKITKMTLGAIELDTETLELLQVIHASLNANVGKSTMEDLGLGGGQLHKLKKLHHKYFETLHPIPQENFADIIESD